MSDVPWTEGPWKYESGAEMIVGDGWAVASFRGMPHKNPEVEANKQLIEAAPALVDGAEETVDELKRAIKLIHKGKAGRATGILEDTRIAWIDLLTEINDG